MAYVMSQKWMVFKETSWYHQFMVLPDTCIYYKIDVTSIFSWKLTVDIICTYVYDVRLAFVGGTGQELSHFLSKQRKKDL